MHMVQYKIMLKAGHFSEL